MTDVEGAQLQKLLGISLAPGLLEAQDEWQDVPPVVRRSFLLLANELRRLRRLVAANRQDPLQRPQDSAAQDVESQISALRTQLQDAQDVAIRRHRRTNEKLSNLWGEVAATAQAAAEQVATSERLSASWRETETQLLLLQSTINEQQHIKQDQHVEQALHELHKSHVVMTQKLRRLQKQFAAHDQHVVGTTEQVQEEVRAAEYLGAQGGKKDKKHDRAVHVLLHQRYVEALQRQQQSRGGLSPVAEHGVST